MRRVVFILGAFFLAISGARADFTYNFTTTPSFGGIRGLVLDRSTDDLLPHGIIFNYGGQFAWGMGLDSTLDYSYSTPPFQLPDLVLAFSRHTGSDNLRLRSDDARMTLGTRVGHPTMPFQFSVEAGTPTAPLGGIALGTYDYQPGVYLYNRTLGKRRTCVNFYNLWGLGTDEGSNGGRDFWLNNYSTGNKVLRFAADDSLKVSAPKIGFYGATPASQPVVSGSWSDGSAQRSFLAALVKLGLVKDQTTP